MRSNDVDRERLGLFGGALAVLAVVTVAGSRLADVPVVALAPLYMFSPAIAALAVGLQTEVTLSSLGMRLGRPRWLVAAAVVALPLVLATLGLSVAVPGVTFESGADPIPGLALPSGLLGVAAVGALVLGLGATVNAAFALGEELGWRGYLLWELAPLGFWRASVGIGAVWGIWHAPVILGGYNYPSYPVVGVLVMTVACVAFSPLYTYVVLRSRSVLAAALLHGVFNGSAGLVLAYANADGEALGQLVTSPVGAAGIVAFGLAAVVIALSGTPRLTRGTLGSDSPVPKNGRTTMAED